MPRCNSAMRADMPHPVLPYVCDRRAAHLRSRPPDSRPFCQNAWLDRKSPRRRGVSDDLVEALGLDTAGHPPACVGADERVVVPEAAEQNLLLLRIEHHRIEAEDARRRGVT